MIDQKVKDRFAALERTKWRPRCDYPDAVRWQHFLCPSDRIFNKLNENTFYQI